MGMQRYGRTGTSIADGSLQCHSSEFAAFVCCADEMVQGQIATLCVLAVLVTLTIDLEALPSLVFVCLLLHHYSNTPSSLLSRYFHLKRMQSSTTNKQSQQSIRDTTTNKRIQKQRLNNEIQQLVKDIWRVGDPQKPQVPFGELFDDDDVQQHYEGLAATLKAAKKRKLFLCYCWW